MGHPKQNLPRKLAGARRAQPLNQLRRDSRIRLRLPIKASSLLASIATLTIVLIAVGAILAAFGESSQAARHRHIDEAVTSLLAKIPQNGSTLGYPAAQITMQVYSEVECQDSREWFKHQFPRIVEEFVRPGYLKLEYRAFKTNTIWPQTFVDQQTAALAAGTQGKLWNYVDTFYHEQGIEYTHYANEAFLTGIATQVPGLDIPQWHTARGTGRRSEQVAEEDHTARDLMGLHVTPTFMIGLTGSKLHQLTSTNQKLYTEQTHPVYFPNAKDVEKAITKLDPHLLTHTLLGQANTALSSTP